MSKTNSSFYVIGGTLHRTAECYVHRQADEDLYAELTEDEFCYVLTPRQMGKSSLMVRTAVRLREAGAAVIILDLTAIGQHVSVEQWYHGLIDMVGRQLGIKDDLADFWIMNDKLGPLQRWMKAMREVVLARSTGKVIIFIDEIDAVRRLPFSTDEFFAGIREFFNRRTEDPELSRLTFCLLGVATPSNLIQDTRVTPFNIGRRIELTDFTADEAAPLAEGLGQDQKVCAALLQRIIFWTGGHPYLTQRLCQSIAEDASVVSAAGVDRVCEEIFSLHAGHKDDNLMFVRERILKSETELASLLNFYGKVHRDKQVRDDEKNPLVASLNLSGITKVKNGFLSVRNHIYIREFDQKWITSNMPEGELRRQKEAYRRGLFKSARYAAVILMALVGLAVIAVKQRQLTLYVPREDARAAYERGVDAMRAGAYQRASAEFERAIQLDGKYLLAHARLAEAWLELDFFDRMREELLAVSEIEREFGRDALGQLDALYVSAVTSTVRREYAIAAASYEEIARLDDRRPETHFDAGRAHEKNDNTAGAISSYLRATEVNRRYAPAFLRLGMLYARQSDNPAATFANFDQAQRLFEAQNNAEGRAEVHYQRGYYYYLQGKIPEARAELEQALKLAGEVGNQAQRVRALLQLCAVAYRESNSALAERYAQEALEAAQALGMETLTARAHVELGGVYMAASRYTEAEKSLQQGFDYARRNKAQRAEAQALINLGSLRYQQGRADEAIDYISSSLGFYQGGGFRKEESLGLLIIARAYRLKGDFEGALRTNEEQLMLANQIGDRALAALAHDGIGKVLALQEKYPQALEQFGQKFLIDKELSRKGAALAYGLADRGHVLTQLGRHGEAREQLEQAAALLEQPTGGPKDLLVHVHVLRAELALSRNEFKEAAAHAGRALSLAGTQHAESVVEAKRVLGLARVMSGARSEGLRSCVEADQKAAALKNTRLAARTTLALARARLEAGDARGALPLALAAQDSFTRHGQLASAWWAWAVAARASRDTGAAEKAREYAARAAEALERIRGEWGEEAYKIYLDRPDVRYYYDRLGVN